MRTDINFKSYFAPDMVEPILLGERSTVDTRVFDEYFRDQADSTPFTKVSLADLANLAEAQPLVADGAESIGIRRIATSVDGATIPPVRLNGLIGAEEINALQALPTVLRGRDPVRSVTDGIIRRIRDDLAVTINGLSAQAVSLGRISWPVKLSDGVYTTFVLDFSEIGEADFSILDVRPEKDLTALVGVKASDWVEYVDAIEDAFEDRQQAAPGGYKLGRNAWKGLMAIASASKRNEAIEVKQGVVQEMIPTPEGKAPRYRTRSYIDVGGHRFWKYGDQYKMPELVNGVPRQISRRVVADDNVMATSEGARFQFRFLSISDLDIGFAALVLALKSWRLKDPSVEKILGQSRPMPIPNLKAIMNSPAKPAP